MKWNRSLVLRFHTMQMMTQNKGNNNKKAIDKSIILHVILFIWFKYIGCRFNGCLCHHIYKYIQIFVSDWTIFPACFMIVIITFHICAHFVLGLKKNCAWRSRIKNEVNIWKKNRIQAQYFMPALLESEMATKMHSIRSLF